MVCFVVFLMRLLMVDISIMCLVFMFILKLML